MSASNQYFDVTRLRCTDDTIRSAQGSDQLSRDQRFPVEDLDVGDRIVRQVHLRLQPGGATG